MTRDYLIDLAAMLLESGYRNLHFSVEPFMAMGEAADPTTGGYFSADALGLARFVDLTLEHDKAQGSEPYLAWCLDLPGAAPRQQGSRRPPDIQLALMTDGDPSNTVTEVSACKVQAHARIEAILGSLNTRYCAAA